MRSGMNVLLLAALLIAGCGGGKAANSSPFASVDFSPFQGIYQIESHTLNSSACDAEGSPVVASKPLLVLFPFFALDVGSFAMASPCADAGACRDYGRNPTPIPLSAADIEVFFDPMFFQVVADGLAGSAIETCCSGASGQTGCGEVGGEEDKLVKDGSKIRIEIREWNWPGTVAQEGSCDRARAARTLAGTCSSLRVINASFQEAL